MKVMPNKEVSVSKFLLISAAFYNNLHVIKINDWQEHYKTKLQLFVFRTFFVIYIIPGILGNTTL